MSTFCYYSNTNGCSLQGYAKGGSRCCAAALTLLQTFCLHYPKTVVKFMNFTGIENRP